VPSPSRSASSRPPTDRKRAASRASRRTVTDGLSGLADQLANRILKPLGLVILSRERIQETLDEAAERGRITRTDANELAGLLIERGRQQTDELLGDMEGLLDRGRRQLDRARRTVGVGPSFPISGYDGLTVAQVRQRLQGLTPRDLRQVRDYERGHGNRKSVLTAIDKRLG
jgi:polyhydroxyalkanoate synthesis regulator phasin